MRYSVKWLCTREEKHLSMLGQMLTLGVKCRITNETLFTLKCLFVLFKQVTYFIASLSPLINHCVVSFRKQHITSCFVFVSERQYKEYSYFPTLYPKTPARFEPD